MSRRPSPAKQLRQLGDVGGDAPGFVPGEQLGGRGVLENRQVPCTRTYSRASSVSIRVYCRSWTVKASHHEETGDNCCATLNGVVGCSASRDVERPATVRHRRPVSTAWPTTGGGSGPPVSTVAGPDDGRFLHRGNDRDVLQCTQRPEHEWLWIERRVRSERRVRVERRVRSEPRRPQQHVVRPPLRKRNAGERTVRLTTRGRAGWRRGR